MISSGPESGAPEPATRPPAPGRWNWLAVLAGCAALLVAALWLGATQRPASAVPDSNTPADAARIDLAIRVRLADRSLRSIAALVTDPNPNAALAGATERHYFAAMVYARAGRQPVPWFGTLRGLPALPEPLAVRIANGDTVMVALAGDAGEPGRMIMVRGLPGTSEPGALLIAEVAPQFLWDAAGSRAGAAELCLRGDGGAKLLCSDPRARAALGALKSDLPAAAGTLRWRSGADSWAATYVPLDLPALDAGDRWTILAMASAASAGASAPIARRLGAVAIGLALLGAIVAFVWLRRGRVAALAGEGGERAVMANRQSSPEQNHAPVHEATIPQRLDRQRRTVQAVADLQRAALSRAEPERLIELAVGHVFACTGCELFLIGMLDHDVSGRIDVVLHLKNGEALPMEHAVVDLSVSRLLTTLPGGIWVPGVHNFPLLVPQAQRGVVGALVLPIYADAGPTGILSLGYPGAEEIGAEEANAARAIVGGLSLALTCAGQAKAIRAHDQVDATTSLPNRDYLKTHVAQLMKRARRERAQLAVLFIGLDGFKKVNVSGGHDLGDLVLAEAARRLRASVREEDLVVRFGGDEFVVVLSHLTEGASARRVAGKLLDELAQPFWVDETERHLGCSIGISLFPGDAESFEGLLRGGATALADAKAAGRGRYAFFDAAVNRAALELTEFERDLHRSLVDEQLRVMYQPQIDLRSGKIAGAEALVRWEHPTRGTVSPAEFIEVAERMGLIPKIGEYVMRAACMQFRAWELAGVAPQRVSVNVSVGEVARTDFVARVEGVLRDTGLRPMFLELELTEGMFLGGSEDNVAKLDLIRSRGVHIALDDFGTGYSSLRYLKQLPIDTIKIDQSFVHDMVTDKDSGQIVRAMLELAQSLGKGVVAEGIETDQQRLMLMRWGCEVGQGFFWSPALSGSEFTRFCREWQALPGSKTPAES